MSVSDLLVTGFPGFLASALLPRLLARRDGARAVCVVQAQHLPTARDRVHELVSSDPELAGRVDLVVGDITEPWLGLTTEDRTGIARVGEVWHLAAVYDLTVGEHLARRVNVEGTDHVLEVCAELPDLRRLQYVSTCYVSGRYDGVFAEDSFDEGQEFCNHYESTKFDAELLVRKAMADGVPATIYRPGIVVGDSRTGETQKYDGPYFLASFLRRQARVALVPSVGDVDSVRISLVPRDFVIDAMDHLSVLETSLGRTYALADPHPPTVRELTDTFAHHLGKRVVWLPVPLRPTRALLGTVPGLERLLGIPAEGLDYFASRTTYDTTATTTDLEGTGVRCPAFAEYADTLLDFMSAHPEVGSSAMV